jgi:hypothetical protein
VGDFSKMPLEGVCLERKLLIPEAKVEEVAIACQKALKAMGLKVTKTETTKEGTTTVLAAEGALVPLTVRTLLYPFNLQDYIKAAQRSGVHVAIAPSPEGVIIHSCGIALDERTGKPATYTSDEDVEEMTDTLEAIDFENKFINKIKTLFPKTKEID